MCYFSSTMDFKFENNIIKMPDFELDEKCGGIGNIYFNAFKKYSHRVALINCRTDEYYTYFDLLKICIRTAIELQNRGLKSGDKLAICSGRENLNAIIPILAGQFLGLITFSLDPELTVHECAELLEQVQPNIVFVTEESEDTIRKSFEMLNAKSEIIIFETTFKSEFIKEQVDESSFKPIFISNLKETCVIHFSSGSTGLPKPICQNHYFYLSLIGKSDWGETTERPCKAANNKPIGRVSLRFSNWYWVSTSMEMMMYLFEGGCILLWEDFDANELWWNVDKYSVTNIFLTPLQCVEFSMTTKPDGVDISSLDDLHTGGYILHKDFLTSLRRLLPDTHVTQAYGMTEAGTVSFFDNFIPKHRKLSDQKPNSCGLPVKGLWYKVLNLETGNKCENNEIGELYLKGKALFNGFYNKDASESFDDDGYFRTGDLVTFDDEFCFFIMDRIKQYLGWRDYVIYPYHVEKVLLDHPSVFNAVVIGIPHKIDGDRLMGVVVRKKDAPEVTAEELIKYVDERVEDYKRLREGIKFMNEFPLTITGKISRIKIKQTILNNFKFSDIS